MKNCEILEHKVAMTQVVDTNEGNQQYSQTML